SIQKLNERGASISLLLQFAYPKLNASVDSRQGLIPSTIQNWWCEGSSSGEVDCTGSSANADSLADTCQDLDPIVDLPALLLVVSNRALADSDSLTSLRLFDPRSGPTEGSSSLSSSSSRLLFRVIVSPYASRMILLDS
nr:hypothetical protein [Tanacetum cinerariifolium]